LKLNWRLAYGVIIPHHNLHLQKNYLLIRGQSFTHNEYTSHSNVTFSFHRLIIEVALMIELSNFYRFDLCCRQCNQNSFSV